MPIARLGPISDAIREAAEAKRQSAVRIPQIIITLSPQGDLQAELPWAGGRRIIQLGNTHGSKRDEAIETTLRRMLEAQRDQRVIVGEDGAPKGISLNGSTIVMRRLRASFASVSIRGSRSARPRTSRTR